MAINDKVEKPSKVDSDDAKVKVKKDKAEAKEQLQKKANAVAKTAAAVAAIKPLSALTLAELNAHSAKVSAALVKNRRMDLMEALNATLK